MESATHYRNGKSKAKNPRNIKYKPEWLRKNIRESNALSKFVRGKIGFRESSKELYITHMATYCYFHQKTIGQLIKEYKEIKKELSDSEDEEDLQVYIDITEYAQHCADNKQAKSTIQGKVKRVKAFLKKNGINIPYIDIRLQTYDDSDGYYTKKDLPDKETMQTIVNNANPKYAAMYTWVYTTGSGRSETANLKVKDIFKSLEEFCDSSDPRSIIKELQGKCAEKEIVPIIKMKRQKTGMPYYTVTTPECIERIFSYINSDLSILDDENGKLFGIKAGAVGNAFKDTNLKYGFGKRGRYNFFGCHRLRHNHYTQINNPNLANALEGRVVRDKITKTYDHNLDDPEYLRQKYKDHMHKFEIFDHYNLQINSEAMQKLQDENEELRKQISEYEQTIDELQESNTTIVSRMDTLENQLNKKSNEKIVEQLIDYASNHDLVKEYDLMDIVMELYRNKFKDTNIVYLNKKSMEELVYSAYNIKINRKTNKKTQEEYEMDPFFLENIHPIYEKLHEIANTFLKVKGYKLSHYQRTELNKIISEYSEKIYDSGGDVNDINEYLTEQQLKDIITDIALGNTERKPPIE